MANATSSTNAKVLPGLLQTKLGGNCSYVINSDEAWVYKKGTIGNSSTLFNTSDKYLELNTNLTTAKQVCWICIKHTGKNSSGENTSESIMLSFGSNNPLYNGTGGANTNNLIIGPKEILVLKLNGVTVADLRCASVNYIGGGIASSAGAEIISADVIGVVSS
tara:strand:+ start:116 stop:604 length:489 start_codon:yes stop_codon:yes gene_type:complete